MTTRRRVAACRRGRHGFAAACASWAVCIAALTACGGGVDSLGGSVPLAATCDGTGTRSAQEDADTFYRHAYRAHHGTNAPDVERPPFSSFYTASALKPYESNLPDGEVAPVQVEDARVVEDGVTTSRAFVLDDTYQDLAGLRLDLGLRCDEPVPLPERKQD